MKYFITGATGQVGHSLVKELVKSNSILPKDVVCLVRTPEKASNLHNLNVTIVQGTLNETNKIKNILQDHSIDIVFHVGAISDPSQDEALIYSTNVDGSKAILEAFIESDAHCFVFASSISVYNSYMKSNGRKIGEEEPIGSLTEGDAYARSKRIIETEIQKLMKKYPNKQFRIARIGPISGTYDRILIPKLLSVMSKSWLPKLINRGKISMSIVAPEDVAGAMIYLAQNSNKIPDVTYNVTGELVTFKEMFNLVADYYGIRHPKFSIPMWLFKALKPVFWLLRTLFPKNEFINLVFSKTAIAFFSQSYDYDRTKIESLGYKFRYIPLQSIQMGIELADPEKKLIKR